MLVLSLGNEDSVIIPVNNNKVVEIFNGAEHRIKLRISAPKDVLVFRKALWEQVRRGAAPKQVVKIPYQQQFEECLNRISSRILQEWCLKSGEDFSKYAEAKIVEKGGLFRIIQRTVEELGESLRKEGRSGGDCRPAHYVLRDLGVWVVLALMSKDHKFNITENESCQKTSPTA